MVRKNIPIRYTSRDYPIIRADLDDLAKRYYPNSYKDFSEASFGSLMFDSLAYIGDMLSWNLDYAVNEGTDNAAEYGNIVRNIRQLGYKFQPNFTSYGIATFYLVVPAQTNGLGPDVRYLPVLAKGSEFSSTAGTAFLLNEDIDFADSNNQVVVAETNAVTGLPTYYAVRAYGRIISGRIYEFVTTVSDYERFVRISLPRTNVAEVMSVLDLEGHEYYEVEHLSQNIIFRPITNADFSTDGVPYLLRTFMVPRRFTVERDDRTVYLQFGYGSEDILQEQSMVDPSDVILERFARNYVTESSFDPSKLIHNDKLGVAPSNTSLRIVYRANTSVDVNASAGSVTRVVNPSFSFADEAALSRAAISRVISSLEINNDETIVGDVSLPTAMELKMRGRGHYAAQDRAVTEQDYKSAVYNMPPQFGTVKRCRIFQDHSSFKRALRMYVISQGATGKLTATNNTIKTNLKYWLSTKRMVNDIIDIYDAKIVNFGIEFDVIANPGTDRDSVLSAAIRAINNLFTVNMEIGEPLYITSIYNVLNKLEDVADVKKVRIVAKTGASYSDTTFDIAENTSGDGRYIMVPNNVVMELRSPNADIKGSVR